MDNRKKVTLDDLPEELIQLIASKVDATSAVQFKFCSKKYFHSLDALFFRTGFKDDETAVKEAFRAKRDEAEKYQIQKFLNSAIGGIVNYICARNEADSNTPRHEIDHYDKGYHRAFCFLNILQCPPLPKEEY